MNVTLNLYALRDELLPIAIELSEIRNALEDINGWERPVMRLETALHYLDQTRLSIAHYIDRRPTGLFERSSMDDSVFLLARSAVATGRLLLEMAREDLDRREPPSA